MSDVAFQFSTQGVDCKWGGGGNNLPVGRHKVVIEAGEQVAVKDKPTNFMLSLTLRCIEGAAQGQAQTVRLNLQNENPTAQRIAYQQMGAFCVVTGHPQGIQQRLSEIFNVPFYIDVDYQAGADAREKGYVEVKKVYDVNGQEPGAQGGGSGGSQAAGPGPQHGQQQPQGGFGGGAPAGGGFGGGAPMGGGAAPAPAGAFGAAPAGAFGGGAPQQQQQPPAGPGPQGGGFGGGQVGGFGNQPQGGAAPWGARQ